MRWLPLPLWKSDRDERTAKVTWEALASSPLGEEAWMSERLRQYGKR
jgi:hypothetical protein